MRAAIVIPCFDEEHRLRREPLEALLGDPRVALVLVDDGSRDGTGALLRRYAAELGPRVEALSLPKNRGKAEAVRAGLSRALGAGAEIVGYADADMSTPPREVLRLLDELVERRADAVLGSRVLTLGARIERNPIRHYAGRVYATFASLALELPIYDTQCGAKILRDSPALRAALAEPFLSRWAFDVELIGRLVSGGVPVERIVEIPLLEWRDVPGSKLKPLAMIRSGLELFRIGIDLRRRRGRARFPRSQ